MWDVKLLPRFELRETELVKYNDCGKEVAWSILERITESWVKKLTHVKHCFEFDMNQIIDHRSEKFKFITNNLMAELNDIKQQLCEMKEFNKYKLFSLKSSWMEAISSWKVYVQDIEKETTCAMKKSIGSFVENIISSRQDIDLIPDLLMSLIIEFNQIILGNAHIITETSHHLNLLWENYFRQWKIDTVYHSWNTEEKEEHVSEEEGEEEEENLFSERFALILNEISMLKELRTIIIPHFQKTQNFHHIIQHLETCSENIKASETIIIECMESEFETLAAEKEKISEAKKRSSRNSIEEIKVENDLNRHNQYEDKFCDLAFSAKYFFETTTRTISDAVKSWNSLLDEKLKPVKHLTTLMVKKIGQEYNGTIKGVIELLNIALDQLRSAHSAAVLDQSWNTIEKIHKQLKLLNDSCLDKQCIVLDEFKDRVKVCYGVFTASVDAMTTEPSTSSINSVPSQGSDSNVAAALEAEDDPFLNMIEFIMKNSNNWYNGFIDTLLLLRSEIDMNLMDLENEWVSDQKVDILFRHYLRSESIDWIIERAKKDIYNVRRSEIVSHENTLIAHVNGVNTTFSEMKKSVNNFEENLRCLEIKYEEAYKELLKIKDIEYEEAKFHEVLGIIKNVKVQLEILQDQRKHVGSRMLAFVDRQMEWIQNANLDLLCNIRLFNEGGNFSSEEATGVIYALNRVHTDMKKEKKLLITRIKKTLKKKVDNYSSVADKVLAGMKKKLQEITFKLNLDLTVDRTKRAISREIFKAREQIKRIENLLEARKKSRRTVLWEELVEEIAKCCLYLTNNFKEEDEVKMRKSKTRSSRSFMSTIGRSTFLNDQKFISVKGKLTPVLTLENFSFTVRKFIKDSKVSLLRQIQNFYSLNFITKKPVKKRRMSIIDGSKVVLKQYEESFNKLRHTSNVAWLNLVYDVLCVLFLFRTDLKKILESKCEIYQSVCQSRLENIEKNYFHQIQQYEREEESKLILLTSKLKSLFGFPKNNQFLLDLEAEANSTCKKSISCYKIIVDNFRDEIRDFLNIFQSISNRLLQEMIHFIESIYKSKSLEDFLGNIEKNIKKMFEKSKKNNQLQKNENEDILEEEDFGVPCLMQSMPHLLNLLRCSLKLLGVDIDTSSFKVDTIETSIDYESIVYMMKQVLVADCRRMVESAIERYNSHSKRIQEWYRNWHNDIKEIDKLFIGTINMK